MVSVLPQAAVDLPTPQRVAANGAEGSPSSRNTGVARGSETPTIDELRRLQCRLSEVTGKLPERRGHQRIQSSGSVSTMVSEGEDLLARSVASSLRHALSSGSVSTMVSEMWEETYEEQGGEIRPVYEEKARYSDDFSHCRVPRSLNLAEQYLKANHEEPPTTMMIRNIPNRYTQRELIRELEDLGFAGSFNFLYVPIDKATMCNVGYAFVNFVDHLWAARCVRAFDNYPFKKYRKARGKIASVSVAHIQGLEANLRHYENAAVNAVAKSRQRGPMLMASIASSFAHT